MGPAPFLLVARLRASGRFPGAENPRQGEGSAGASGPGTLGSRGRSRAHAGHCGLVRVASEAGAGDAPRGPREAGDERPIRLLQRPGAPHSSSSETPTSSGGSPLSRGVCGHRGSGKGRRFGRKRPLRARGVGQGRHRTAPSGWDEQTRREASTTQ